MNKTQLFSVFVYLLISTCSNAQHTTLYNFAGTDGSSPLGSLISDGTFLYGMTNTGGIYNKGTVFKIMPDGTGYVQLLDFDGPTNGANPGGGLIYDGTFLYSMTRTGGENKIYSFGLNFIENL